MGDIVHFRVRGESKKGEGSDVFDAISAWLEARPGNTKRSYLRIARAWSKFLGAEIDTKEASSRWKKAAYPDAQRYINECRNVAAQPGRSARNSIDGKVCNATLKYKANVLKSLYDCLIASDLCTANPFARIAAEVKKYESGERRPHNKIPTPDVKKLLTFSIEGSIEARRDRAIMHLLLGAALRRSEIVSLQLGDVMTSPEGTVSVRLRMTKAQKLQAVALPDFVALEVCGYIDERRKEGATDSDPLFVNHYHCGPRLMSDMTVYKMFKRRCKQLGIVGDYTPHACRVTAITRLLDQGYSHRETQELSRHSSVQMVERYDRKRTELDKSTSKKLSYDE